MCSEPEETCGTRYCFVKNSWSGLRQCCACQGGGEGSRLDGSEKLGLHPIKYPQSRSVTSGAEGGRLFYACCSLSWKISSRCCAVTTEWGNTGSGVSPVLGVPYTTGTARDRMEVKCPTSRVFLSVFQ